MTYVQKKYPRRFVTDTQTGEVGYPVYLRRDVDNGGQVFKVVLHSEYTWKDCYYRLQMDRSVPYNSLSNF